MDFDIYEIQKNMNQQGHSAVKVRSPTSRGEAMTVTDSNCFQDRYSAEDVSQRHLPADLQNSCIESESYNP